jgi:hypothetical protein
MNGWAVSLAGCALLFGVFVGFWLDGESGCERAAQEYFLSVQISGADGATQTAGVAFAVECDLPLLPNVGPTVTPTVGPVP